MLFSTPSHFLVLALVALGFWLIGFASHPGGRKWRKMYDQEAKDHSIHRMDCDGTIRAANRRVVELERERAELAARVADLQARAPAVPDDTRAPGPGAAGYNDLTAIHGIDGVLSTRLFGLGMTRFTDIEKLSAADEIALEQRLHVPAGLIAREQWREQAALLRAGNIAEHTSRFGAPPHA